MVLSLAESLVLPFGLRHLSAELARGIGQLESANLTRAMRAGGAGPAYDRMVAHAQEQGADAVVAMRFDATEFSPGITEVLAYGTAVRLAKTHE